MWVLLLGFGGEREWVDGLNGDADEEAVIEVAKMVVNAATNLEGSIIKFKSVIFSNKKTNAQAYLLFCFFLFLSMQEYSGHL